MNAGSHRELEEMRIIRTVQFACRCEGVIAHPTFQLNFEEDADSSRTIASFEYYWAPVWKVMRRAALSAMLFCGGLAASTLYIQGFTLVCFLFVLATWGAGVLTLAIYRYKRITAPELMVKVDAALAAEGFKVNRSDKSWTVVIDGIDDEGDEGEEWKVSRGTQDA